MVCERAMRAELTSSRSPRKAARGAAGGCRTQPRGLLTNRAEADQPRHFEQMSHSVQITVYGIGNTGVLHFEHQLQPVATAHGTVNLAK